MSGALRHTAASVQKADQLAKQWLSGVYTAWLADGVMHEKYNGLEPGVYGKGGMRCDIK